MAPPVATTPITRAASTTTTAPSAIQNAIAWGERFIKICYNDYLVPLFNGIVSGSRQGYGIAGYCCTVGLIFLAWSWDQESTLKRVGLTLVAMACFIGAGLAFSFKSSIII